MTSQAKPEGERFYIGHYRDRKALVCAASSYEAQCKAAAMLKAKKRFDVMVYLADAPHAGARLL